MRVAVDAAGGDFAPQEIVSGALRAAAEFPLIGRMYLVGPASRIREAVRQSGMRVPDKVEFVDAPEVVDMGEAPAAAVRRKKDSSIVRAVDLVRAGTADAVFSAGNTGAMVAAATLRLGRLDGISRPAIATVIPAPGKPFVLIDAGANTDCEALWLAEFAVMGNVYAREILGVDNPRIGLVSVGGEESKGNQATRAAFTMLEKSTLNFTGNVEAGDMFGGKVDVAVCDGFVGNVILKTSESVAESVSGLLKEAVSDNPLAMLGGVLLKGAFSRIRRRCDPAAYGGAPLLGVKGVCIIGHGASRADAVYNALRVVRDVEVHRVNQRIVEEIRELKERIEGQDNE
ncbi:MAG: phosphate acyltransferase PlsX [Verrucomicrobia bacterium]|nr:MAG: phosphate acyltransferase PlsX [Verrucomicrobiota bacterium]